MTFKDHHRELQELVRELELLRKNNLPIKEGEPQDKLLLFAEAALVCLVLERFVRAVLGAEAKNEDTLHNLLEKAAGNRLSLIRLPGNEQKDAVKRICAVRNTLLHGNYEQAAHESGCASVGEYFKTQFAAEVERLYEITNFIVNQIDPVTGQPKQALPRP